MARFFLVLDGSQLSVHASATLDDAQAYVEQNKNFWDALVPVEFEAAFSASRPARFDVLELTVDERFHPEHALAVPQLGKCSGESESKLFDLTREKAFHECAEKNQKRLWGEEAMDQWSVVIECGEPADVHGLTEWLLDGINSVESVHVFRAIRIVEPLPVEVVQFAEAVDAA